MKNGYTVTSTFNVKAEKIYKAWLSSKGHSAMTGSPAKVAGKAQGKFSAWDGYIWGRFLELEDNKKILQTWRTSEFPEDAEDSIVEILLKEEHGGTKLTLKHSNIPAGQAEDYKQGWREFYFKPMKEYFKSK